MLEIERTAEKYPKNPFSQAKPERKMTLCVNFVKLAMVLQVLSRREQPASTGRRKLSIPKQSIF